MIIIKRHLNKFHDFINNKLFDLWLSLFLIFLSILALFIGLLRLNFFLQQSALVLLSATLSYLLLRIIPTRHKKRDHEDNKIQLLFLNITFFVLLSSSILWLYNNPGERSLLFLGLAALMAMVLANEIFMVKCDKEYFFVLVEIVLLGILVRTSAYYQFPSLPGGDPWVHAGWIRNVISSGHVSSNIGGYESFPLFHLFNAIISIITDLSVKDSMCFTGIGEVLSLMFVFLLVKLSFNGRVALNCVLILALSTTYILWGFLLVPQTLALIFLPMLLFLVFQTKKNLSKIYLPIMLLIMIVIILTHTLTSAATLLILASILVTTSVEEHLFTSKAYNKTNVSFLIPCLFLVAMIAYWSYASNFILYIEDSVRDAFSVAYLSPPASTVSERFISIALRWLPIYLLIFFAIIGSLYLLRNLLFKSVAFYGWLIVVFVAFSTFLGLSAFLPGRWFVFIELTLIVPAIIGIEQFTKIHSPKIFRSLVILVLALVNLTNYQANITNVNPLTPYPTEALKISELAAFRTMVEKQPTNVNIYVDYYYGVCSIDNKLIDSKPLKNGSLILLGTENLNGIILLRNEIQNNAFFASLQEGSAHPSIVNKLQNSFVLIQDKMLIYSSNTVKGLSSK